MTQISFLRSYQQRENINSEATPISNAIQSRHATTPETESDAATPELQLSHDDLLSEFKRTKANSIDQNYRAPTKDVNSRQLPMPIITRVQ